RCRASPASACCALSSCFGEGGSRWKPAVSPVLSGDWEPDEEDAGFVRLCRHVSVDAAGETACQREAETRTVSVSVAGAAAYRWLEDLLALGLAHPRPVVRDAVHGAGPPAGQRDLDTAAAVAAGVLDDGLQNPLGEVGLDAEADRLPRPFGLD